MKTILLISADGHLASRIGASLARDENVLRLTPFPPVLAPPGAWHNVIVVIDCRGLGRAETEHAIIRVRALNGDAFRCVALADGAPRGAMDVIGRGGTRDHDVVLAEHDHVGSTLRAILNDPDGSVGTAIALEVLWEHLFPIARQIAEAVLSSGCRVSSVGTVEPVLGNDRGELGEKLAAEGSPGPKAIVRVARATYAVVLVRRTNLTFGNIAKRIGYSVSRWMQGLLVAEFGARAEELKARAPDMPIECFLDQLLADWTSGAARGGGGGLIPATISLAA